MNPIYCPYCPKPSDPGSKVRKRRAFANGDNLNSHIDRKHPGQFTLHDFAPRFTKKARVGAKNTPTTATTTSNNISLDASLDLNINVEDLYDETVYMGPDNPFEGYQGDSKIKYDVHHQPNPTNTMNAYEPERSLSPLAAKLAEHVFNFCISEKEYASIVTMLRLALNTDGTKDNSIPSTIKGLRNAIRKDGKLVSQEFSNANINLTDVANFPAEHIDDFKKATNNQPITFSYRNIREVTQSIFSSPRLAADMILSPATASRYDDVVFDDLHTSQWWSDVQRSVDDNDTVVLPLMLSSDATLVSGNGKNKAWPIYLSLGNVPKSIRNKKDYGANRVLGYFPVIHILSNAPKYTWMSRCKMAIYQHCVKTMMAPFSSPASSPAALSPSASSVKKTMYFQGPFGRIYKCLPMLATYSADYPEQCLLAATKSFMSGFGCPRCTIKASDYKYGMDVVANKRTNGDMTNVDYGSFGMVNAFWTTPYDIYDALVVDDLHQLGGVYRHLLRWIEDIIREDRNNLLLVEERCLLLPSYTGLKRFESGFLLSSLNNPSFNEFRKHMQLILCLVYDLIPLQCTLCLRAFVDFFVQVNSKEHSQATLSAADEFLRLFFLYLPAFQSHSPMKIPKLHMLTKYTYDIKMKGPLDGYTTMHSERQHKTNAKQPAKRSNFRDPVSFLKQLTRFIEDRDVYQSLYGSAPAPAPAPATPLPLPSASSRFSLKSEVTDSWALTIEDMEHHDDQLLGLLENIVLFLDCLTEGRPGNRSLSLCTPLLTTNVAVFKQLVIKEMDDDECETTAIIRTGKYYGKLYNDTIKALDITTPKLLSGEHKVLYGKVLLFVEVIHGNSKVYRLCVGQRLQALDSAHPTGYTQLKLHHRPSSPTPSLFVCLVEHITSKVFVVPDFGTDRHDRFLLNHDVDEHAWTSSDPRLPVLTRLERWNEEENDEDKYDEDDEDEYDEDDVEDAGRHVTNLEATQQHLDGHDDNVEDFLPFI